MEKLKELTPYTIAALALIALMGGALMLTKRRRQMSVRALAMGSLCVAASFVLSCIRLFTMAQGGSITPAAMLPLVLYSVAFGALPGLLAGSALGLLQLIQGAFVVHPLQMLLDYPIAFAAVALGGVLRGWKNDSLRLPLAVLIGALGRYLCSVLSGTVFFYEYAGDQNPLLYSLVYNISYLGPDAIVCIALAALPAMPRLQRMMAGR